MADGDEPLSSSANLVTPVVSQRATAGDDISGSLRRRVFFGVLVLVTVPGYLALLLSWLGVSQAARIGAREQTTTMAKRLAVELDQQLMRHVESLAMIASDKEFSETTRRHVTAAGEAGSLYPPLDFTKDFYIEAVGAVDNQLYMVNTRGRVALMVKPGEATTNIPAVTPLDHAPFLGQVAVLTPTVPFAAETAEHEPENPLLLLGVPVAPAGDMDEPLYLVAPIAMADVFAVAEKINPSLGQRLVVVSARDGTIHMTNWDEDYRTELDRARGRFFPKTFPQIVNERLEILPIRSIRQGVASAPMRSLSNMSTSLRLPDVQWVAIDSINLDEALAAVTRVLWSAVIIGLVLTLAALGLAVWTSGRMVAPVLHLTEGMQRFAKGDLQFRVNVHTGDELEKLGRAANHMAASLRQSYSDLAQRMLQLDENARQLELIYAISHSVNRVLDLDRLCERIINELLEQVPCERVSLGLLQEGGQELLMAYVHPRDRDLLPKGTRLPLQGTVVGTALKDQVLTIKHLRPHGKTFEDQLLAPLGFKVICAIPLMAANGAVGALTMATCNEELLGRSELKFLERISESLALAIEHGRLYDRTARFALELEETVDKRTKELRLAQEKLVQAEKFAATGSMAAHIAHEVNNPLSIIKNFLKMARGHILQPTLEPHERVEQILKNLRIIEEEIDRIARIVSQLRMVSQPARPYYTETKLHDEINKLVDLFQGTLRKKDVAIELDLDPKLDSVHVCADYLRQILINLMRNSMDSMDKEGGILTVRSRMDAPTEGNYTIEVLDTGAGIPAENLSSIFDPFFTTKGEGKGTGLGLSVSLGLATTMGGTLEAFSTLGEGTRMRLVLPLRAMEDAGSLAKELEDQDPAAAPIRRMGRKIIIG